MKVRLQTNEEVVKKCAVSEFDEDVFEETLKDCDEGFMHSLGKLETLPSGVHLTRRLPVRGLRSRGWRTRVVDHMTESFINRVTLPSDAPRHETVDLVIWMGGRGCSKTDIKKAFRNLPINPEHFKLMTLCRGVWCRRCCWLLLSGSSITLRGPGG